MQNELQARAAHNAEVQKRAAQSMAEIGITPEFINRFVDTFYAGIRIHQTLGPVFNDHIKDRWADHLARMKQFWSALAFKTGDYGGRPVQAHMGVHGISPELFPQWLQLFHRTLDESDASQEAKHWFGATAERIARSLTLSLFYNPALDAPKG